MTRWFTSDEHFGHANIIDYCNRPFRDLADMDNQLIERHNAVVRSDDTVYHLGDFALGEKFVKTYGSLLNGTHYLIAGDHDRVHSSYADNVRRKAERIYREAGFIIVPKRVAMELADGEGRPAFRALLSHMPLYDPAGADEARRPKYDAHRPRPDDLAKVGRVQLHGHVHEKWKTKMVGPAMLVNVGVDQWDYAPVSEEALVAFVRATGALNEDALPKVCAP